MIINEMYQKVQRYVRNFIGAIYYPWKNFPLFLLLIGLVSGLVPFLQANSIIEITSHLTNRNIPNIPVLVGWLFLFAFSMFVDLMIKDRNLLTYVGSILEYKLKKRYNIQFLKSVADAPYENFFVRDFLSHIELVRKRGMEDFVLPVIELCRFIAIFISVVYILYKLSDASWYIPFILVVCTVILGQFRVFIAKKWWDITNDQTSFNMVSNYLSSLMTDMNSAAELRIFSLKNLLLLRWTHNQSESLKHDKGKLKKYFLIQIPFFLFLSIIGIVSFLLLFNSFVSGDVNVGEFIAFIYLVSQFEEDVEGLGRRLENLLNLVFFTGLVNEKEKKTQLKHSQEAVKPPSKIEKGIRFENVSYTYPNEEREVLKNISFEMKPGEKIALVGLNGAGKSTLVMLVMGLVKPTKGAIFIDGVDLKTINKELWWEKISPVMQDFVKYSFKVKEIIQFGNLHATEEELIEAARISGLYEIVESLPNKMDTLLGKDYDAGFELSNGQWQKLAVSRAYTRNSELIILDEPASAIDPMAELEIYNHFFNLSKDKTVLLISHRMGSVQLADRIVVLDNGMISEIGSHIELMDKEGGYYHLFKAQEDLYQRGKVADC